MEQLVLIIGGLLKAISWNDVFFFVASLGVLLFLIYVAYLIKADERNDEEPINETITQDKSVENVPKEEILPKKPIIEIVNDLKSSYKPEPIDLSDYEKEMENTAIISYDELVSKANNNIYYDDNYQNKFDDIVIQKVDNKESKTQELVDLPKAVMMNYESEEAFLSALKALQKNLVR